MKFSDIFGHQDIINDLRGMVDTNRIPHAVMLAGPQGIGKLRLARALSQYIHCQNRIGGNSCGKCPSCIQHQKLGNPDMHYVFPIVKRKSEKLIISDDHRRQWETMLEEDSYMSPEKWLGIINAGNSQPAIYVEESEAISETAALSPFKEEKKIFLIWQPERMTVEASNKLLKLIEEPFPDTIFIFASNMPEAVLPTVMSRTRRFNLRPLQPAVVEQALNALSVEPAVARTVSLLAEGSISNALKMAARNGEFEDFSNLFKEMMRAAYARKIGSLRKLADNVGGFGREKQRRFLDYCLRMTRESFIYNLQEPRLNLMTTDEMTFSNRFSPFIHHSNVEEIAEAFTKAADDIRRNANARIVIFDLSMQLCRLIRTVKPR